MKHDLIKTGDKDSFFHIEDRNKEVVLDYCRRCKKGEGELEKECPGPPIDILTRIGEIKEDLRKRFPSRLASLLCNSIDHVHEYHDEDKALEEAEYLHTLGSTVFERHYGT